MKQQQQKTKRSRRHYTQTNKTEQNKSHRCVRFPFLAVYFEENTHVDAAFFVLHLVCNRRSSWIETRLSNSGLEEILSLRDLIGIPNNGDYAIVRSWQWIVDFD